jgi:hypothetical protein
VQSRNSNETSHTWPAKIMVDVGVPFYSIMAIYEGFRVSNSSGLISQYVLPLFFDCKPPPLI